MADRSPDLAWSIGPAAQELSERHRITPGPAAPIPAWKELSAAAAWLHDARLACAEAPPEAGKAAEWLLDNDYQVHRAIRQIGLDLSPGFYARLPRLAGDGEGGFPRVFALAHDLLRVTRLQISKANAVRFTRAYQRQQPLTIAELWAFPTMLRIACLEILISALSPFLHGRVKPPFTLTAWATDPHSMDDTERVARGIANLGLIAAISWEEYFDETSLVEERLGEDPAGYYRRMDFETRDRYRRAAEELSLHGTAGETDVAAEAIGLAQRAPEGDVGRHVGHWLVGDGRAALESRVEARLPFRQRLRRFVLAHPGTFYAAALFLSAVGALILPVFYLLAIDEEPLGWVTALAASFIPASILAVTTVHWAITRTLPPRILPKLDCAKGLPKDCATIVAVPVVIADVSEVPGLVEQIETHWLANSDPMLRIALLADLADAPEKTRAGDEEIVQALDARVSALNKRHGRKKAGPFHLLIRPRLHNPVENVWMAWERKRGKLEQFNRLLIEGDASAFSVHVGHRPALDAIRFVVTVDADTILPPGSVGRLVGTLAHPLNQARFDDRSGMVVSGYSIIQPRTEISPHSGTRTVFARLFTGDTAIDIYSRAVSDIYQDLFGAGIFVGKGIYDLRAFHRSVDGRVPENSILSHDLFEGVHGRVGLATDIVLYEGFPSNYLEYARRLHRWIRGDWQLLPWLGRTVPAPDRSRLEPCFAGIDRWKIFDNLRRSLIAPSMLLLALAGWFVLPGQPWFWTLLAIFAPAGQLFTDLVSGLARGRRRGAVHGLFASLSDQAGRWLLAIVYLLHEAVLSLHAIALTIWRLAVSHRHMLEWTSAAHVGSKLAAQNARSAIWRQMWIGPMFALAIGIALLIFRPGALAPAAPLLLLWMLAPEITARIGRPRQTNVTSLSADDRLFLRGLARRTWYYFETFAGPEDNWLPPDNYQAAPHEEIAHRTSPTNIGMLLLSTATAWDMGYIGRGELAARTENILESLDRLDRYRGHFFNWYDTRTLKPLEPRYVSAVDSGNLAVSLVAHASTLRDAAILSELEAQRWSGLADVLALLESALAEIEPAPAKIRAATTSLRDRITALQGDRDSWLFGLGEICNIIIPAIEAHVAEAFASTPSAQADTLHALHSWLERLRHQAAAMFRDLGQAATIGDTLRKLARRATDLAYAMDFKPLYDKERRLFFIGHNVSSGRTDIHHYDLLASEARLASFFAIAKGDVPIEHWFHLGRPVTRADGGLSLISWNGSMFEYLMPRLLLHSGPESLLGESERIAVKIQQRYGHANRVPWGISESAYGARDPEHRYRYQAFGVPGLGLRRGLTRDMVVAPYASALALAVAPGEAAANLKSLQGLGAASAYGLMEALDFTADRVAEDAVFTPVDAYMAHHQGMILCAIGNALLEDVLVRRFADDPRMRLISLLLSERIPREIPSEIERIEELERAVSDLGTARTPSAWEPTTDASFPQLQLLGNGRLASWISSAGGGGLRWHKHALTRFVPDATRDADGLWLYLADEDSGGLWSATRQPTMAPPDEYRTVFHAHLAEFHRRDHQIETRLEVAVAAGDDLELRRLCITNESGRPRRLRLTSYGEAVLAPPLEDERHPAFSKLFVGSEHLPDLGGLLFTRRARHPREAPPVLLHFLVDADGPCETVRFESDRRNFIGRGNDLGGPAGARSDLSNTAGWTLDPVMSLQLVVELKPYEQRELCFVTVAAASREAAIEIAQRYSTPASLAWAIGDAASDMARVVERTRIDPDRLAPLQALASLIVYPHAPMRASGAKLRANRLGQPHLWGMALSGDLPILLLRMANAEMALLAELIGAHHFWRRQGLACDLVVLQTGGSAYVEPMRDDIIDLLRDVGGSDMLGRNGGIHLLFADQIGAQQVRLIEAAASAILDDSKESIAEHLVANIAATAELPLLAPSLPRDHDPPTSAVTRPKGLLYDNGIGGFSPDGREYVIHLGPGEATPAPWSNVLANDGFGCLVTEAGGGFAWAGNSGENRITPWTNDPVVDRPGEILYLRDEESAAIWSIVPGPAGHDAACEIRHGAGYSRWLKRSNGLEQEMLIFVPEDLPVKVVRLRLRNLLKRHRRITSTYYAEWLLGALPSVSRRHVICDQDTASHALLAQSWWNPDFGGRVAFLGASRAPHGFTTDRREFLGGEGDLARPSGLTHWGLAGTLVAGADPCAAYQVHHDLADGASDEIVFVIGQAESDQAARMLAARWIDPGCAETALRALEAKWDRILGAVEVHTPDRAFDLIVNRWLLYQSLSSRVMARTGLYQSSGAIGFRDQLQDVLALLHCDPERARAHILDCAAHQFEEGDVLHWWHPPTDRGVRTRCSDDLLWLPYAAATYVRATGDLSILHEEVGFLQGVPLGPDEEDRYARFEGTNARRPLIEHCERALDHAATRGAHGLPLIGSGDWNDGMDRVGRAGRGESIWLAWFTAVTADLMADLQRRLGRDQSADQWTDRARELRSRVEESGWDGDWYRRAYDDDGHPVGSAQNAECRIDSISQSWAAFAGADPARVATALQSARRELVASEDRLARLLWPPFDTGPRDPGYIKAYPPGIRENGGQYSHAAAWLGLALAKTNEPDAAYQIFSMINPICRAADRPGADHYRVEPYAVAGDIAAVEPHRGRGGWTWYTGAAAWTWRLGVEAILGLRLHDDKVTIDPCLPPAWGGFEAVLRRPTGTISLRVEDPDKLGRGRVTLTVDGADFQNEAIAFPTDGTCKSVVARIG